MRATLGRAPFPNTLSSDTAQLEGACLHGIRSRAYAPVGHLGQHGPARERERALGHPLALAGLLIEGEVGHPVLRVVAARAEPVEGGAGGVPGLRDVHAQRARRDLLAG